MREMRHIALIEAGIDFASSTEAALGFPMSASSRLSPASVSVSGPPFSERAATAENANNAVDNPAWIIGRGRTYRISARLL